MFFVVFVLMAQFVLVNVVVAVLMKHLEVGCRVTPLLLYTNTDVPRVHTAPDTTQLDVVSGGVNGLSVVAGICCSTDKSKGSRDHTILQ